MTTKLTDKHGNTWEATGGTKIADTGSTYTVSDGKGNVTAELSKDSVTKTESSSGGDLLAVLAIAAVTGGLVT